ncbi:MAG: SRPBCC family protein [Planctomycetales bacterium]|nr:SRPBCC family protein [Planctomycetales bacterium]
MPRYHVQRAIQIAASREKVFETVADFGTWTTWSPWLCAEPDAQVTVTGERAAVGAKYAWQGEIVGAGEIEHLRLEAPRSIEDEIRFIKPFRSQSNVGFELEAVGEETKITWHMQGKLPWFMFWMSSMMETMIGMDYERGLKMLKDLLETGHIESHTSVQGVTSIGPLHMLGVRNTCTVQEIGKSTEAALGKAKQLLQQHHLPSDGEMISVYHRFDMKTGTFEHTSGYIVPAPEPAAGTGLSSWSTPATRAFQVTHIGSYAHLGNAWSAANMISRYKKLKMCKTGTFELYKTTPPETPSGELRTEIYLPLR